MFEKAMAFAAVSASCFGAAQAAAPMPIRTQSTAQSDQTSPASSSLATVGRADVKVGESVKDLSGQVVGIVKKVTAKGAIISTGANRAEVPFAGIRRLRGDLITSVTKAQIDRVDQGKAQVPSAHDGPSMPEM